VQNIARTPSGVEKTDPPASVGGPDRPRTGAPGRGWPKGRPSPRRGMRLGPCHRTSPKRAPVDVPCPPEVLAEIKRVNAMATMLPLTRVKEVVAVMPLDAVLKGVWLSMFNDAWSTTCEGRGKSYADLARETGSSRRITIDRVAQLESYGLVNTMLTKLKPGWNGLNTYRLQIPPAWAAAAKAAADGDPASEQLDQAGEEEGDGTTATETAPGPFVPREAWPAEVNAIGEILWLHASELRVGVDAFAPALWAFACEKPRHYSLSRVLIGIEHAASKAEGARGKELRRFIKGCIEHLNAGATGSPEVKAAVRTAEAAQAPPPMPRRMPVASSLAAPIAPVAAPPAVTAPTLSELLAFLADPQTYRAITERWPGPRMAPALTNLLVVDLPAKGLVTRLPDGRYQATAKGLLATGTGPP